MVSLYPERRNVRRLVGDAARFERRPPGIVDVQRVAVLAHWSREAAVSRSVATLVGELQSFGYRVVVSSSCASGSPLTWAAPAVADELVVIRKPNVGYDFGSWSVALALLPEIARARRVILANDSMAGPFLPLAPFLEQFEQTHADVWAFTSSRQFAYHLQSYFLGFCDGILTSPPLQRFWSGIRVDDEKLRIILRNEIGLGQLLREEGYSQHAAFGNQGASRDGDNPVLLGWWTLLERGFPFLKREILRDPTVALDGARAPSLIKELLGIEVSKWVEDPIPSVGKAPA